MREDAWGSDWTVGSAALVEAALSTLAKKVKSVDVSYCNGFTSSFFYKDKTYSTQYYYTSFYLASLALLKLLVSVLSEEDLENNFNKLKESFGDLKSAEKYWARLDSMRDEFKVLSMEEGYNTKRLHYATIDNVTVEGFDNRENVLIACLLRFLKYIEHEQKLEKETKNV